MDHSAYKEEVVVEEAMVVVDVVVVRSFLSCYREDPR